MSGKHDDLVECGGSKPPMSLDLKIEWERERRERAERQRREARRNFWENVCHDPDPRGVLHGLFVLHGLAFPADPGSQVASPVRKGSAPPRDLGMRWSRSKSSALKFDESQ